VSRRQWLAQQSATVSSDADAQRPCEMLGRGLSVFLLRLARRSGLGADLLAQPQHRLRLTGDERLPFGFRQGDGDDAFALVAHAIQDTHEPLPPKIE
jgi:hypothetical protein